MHGLHKYFLKQSNEEREHAKRFMEYVNKRGGRITLMEIKAPDKNEWGSPLEAMQTALDFEKHVNEVCSNAFGCPPCLITTSNTAFFFS